MPVLTRFLSALFLLLAWQDAAWAQSRPQNQAAVSHTISFPRAANQYVRVESVFPAVDPRMDFSMPNWTPGSYLIRDYAAHVEQVSATDDSGVALEIRKTAKNQWQVTTGGAQTVQLTYDVWAGNQNVAENWVEADFAVLNGAGLFLSTNQSRELNQHLRVVPDSGWNDVRVALPSEAGKFEFTAVDFDELVDSPIVAGNLVVESFRTGDQDYALVLTEQNSLWDLELSVKHLSMLVDAHQAFWKVNPFDRPFLFMNAFLGTSSGLEHDHSTLMMSDRLVMTDRQSYIKWLALASHEFFHAWNVRRLRPAVLNEYDYQNEEYSRELWLAEGLSSYYDNLLLFRSGLVDVADYFALLAQEVRQYEVAPGREVRSAELASFDAWIKQYKQDGNSLNSTISYYRKGALIGFVTDMEIRRASDEEHNLDDVMRLMYERYGPNGTAGQGYPRGAFQQVVEEIAGADVRERLQPLLSTTKDPDVDEALRWYGLELIRNSQNGNSSDELLDYHSKGFPGLGLIYEESGNAVRVKNVILGLAGADAGVLPGDEILAIDDQRVTRDNYRPQISRLVPGDTTNLLLARNGRVLTLQAVVGVELPERYSIVPRQGIRKREKQRLENWLGRGLMFSNR